MDDSSLTPPVDQEDIGVPATALMGNPHFLADLIVMLARRVTGPFGGFVTISPKEYQASQGYRVGLFVKGLDPKTQTGKPTYNLQVQPPPGWSPLPSKQGPK